MDQGSGLKVVLVALSVDYFVGLTDSYRDYQNLRHVFSSDK